MKRGPKLKHQLEDFFFNRERTRHGFLIGISVVEMTSKSYEAIVIT